MAAKWEIGWGELGWESALFRDVIRGLCACRAEHGFAGCCGTVLLTGLPMRNPEHPAGKNYNPLKSRRGSLIVFAARLPRGSG
jgi:hypothetical protein